MPFRFKKFKVYQDAVEFCKYCKGIIDNNITDKDLAIQIRRALNSIVLNIAEGSADNSDIEFARFLGISTRSTYEVVAGFDLAFHYDMISNALNKEIEDKAEEMIKQLCSFRSSLKKKK